MKAIILAAGYATRLYPLTINTPKPLLEVGGKSILEHIVNKIQEVGDVNEIFVVTNAKFYYHFVKWAEKFENSINIKIINDLTMTNESRLGSLGDINYVIEKENIMEDILIVAGDNLFEFSLKEFNDYYKNLNKPVVVSYDVKDKELAKKYGVITVDVNNKIINFQEKPREPESTLASTAVYIYPSYILPTLRNFVENVENTDKAGNFMEWLCSKDDIYSFITKKTWFDIGNHEQLTKARKEYGTEQSNEEYIQILATPEMKGIAKKVCERLKEKDTKFCYNKIEYTVFANKEIKPKIPKSIRHKEVYLIHSLYYPDPNVSYIQLLLTIDAITRASAKSITLVLPFMPYLRQDRKDEPRVPISAKVMANLIQISPKVERILTMDMHCDQAQGFYDIPVDNLYGSLMLKTFFEEKYNGDYSNLVVVSPDHGGTVRARRFAKYLNESVPVYIIDKRRTGPNKVEVMNFVGGDIQGKDIVIVDDMIDTGSSIIAAAKVAKERGAKQVFACATHGLFSSKGITTSEDKFKQAGIKIVITETIPRTELYKIENSDWLTILPIDELFGEAIYKSSKPGRSISSLFD